MSVTNMSATPHAITTAARDGISILRSQLHRAGPMAGLVVALRATTFLRNECVYDARVTPA